MHTTYQCIAGSNSHQHLHPLLACTAHNVSLFSIDAIDYRLGLAPSICLDQLVVFAVWL